MYEKEEISYYRIQGYDGKKVETDHTHPLIQQLPPPRHIAQIPRRLLELIFPLDLSRHRYLPPLDVYNLIIAIVVIIRPVQDEVE